MSGYVLIGFSGGSNDSDNNVTQRNPLFLPNKEIARRHPVRLAGDPYAQFPFSYNGKKYLILPELYKVEWFRGRYDILDVLKANELCYENEQNLFYPYGAVPVSKTSPEFKVWINFQGHSGGTGRTPKDIINEINQKYPGLFTSEFIIENIRATPPIQSKTTKSKRNKQVRTQSETKKHRNQHATHYPTWWTDAPNS